MPRRTKKDKLIAKLVQEAERLGLEPLDLDEAVHELAQETGLSTLNTLENEEEQEEHISAQESAAPDINNGGLEAQIEFLLDWTSKETIASSKEGVEQLLLAAAQARRQGD